MVRLFRALHFFGRSEFELEVLSYVGVLIFLLSCMMQEGYIAKSSCWGFEYYLVRYLSFLLAFAKYVLTPFVPFRALKQYLQFVFLSPPIPSNYCTNYPNAILGLTKFPSRSSLGTHQPLARSIRLDWVQRSSSLPWYCAGSWIVGNCQAWTYVLHTIPSCHDRIDLIISPWSSLHKRRNNCRRTSRLGNHDQRTIKNERDRLSRSLGTLLASSLSNYEELSN